MALARGHGQHAKEKAGNLSFLAQLYSVEKLGLIRPGADGTTFLSLRTHAHDSQAKGYPDVASRSFLRHIANQAPHVPMYALVDLDPDGIAILSTYKYGSYRLAHEDVALGDAPGLSLSNVHWLGLRRQQMNKTLLEVNGTIPELQGLMKLTARDRTKAMRMLEWDLCAEDGPEQDWRHELQTMLVLNIKAEMQILDELPGGLVSWLSKGLNKACGQSLDLFATSPLSDDGMLF